MTRRSIQNTPVNPNPDVTMSKAQNGTNEGLNTDREISKSSSSSELIYETEAVHIPKLSDQITPERSPEHHICNYDDSRKYKADAESDADTPGNRKKFDYLKINFQFLRIEMLPQVRPW